MTKELSIIMESLEEEAGYLVSLCNGAKKALDNNPECKDNVAGNGYPFLYGYVSEGVNYHGKKIKELVESLKELLYEGSDYDKD